MPRQPHPPRLDNLQNHSYVTSVKLLQLSHTRFLSSEMSSLSQLLPVWLVFSSPADGGDTSVGSAEISPIYAAHKLLLPVSAVQAKRIKAAITDHCKCGQMQRTGPLLQGTTLGSHTLQPELHFPVISPAIRGSTKRHSTLVPNSSTPSSG
jgi:hypothetical protein